MSVSSLELTRALLRMNTVNPPGDERACARYLGARLEAAGFTVTYHEFAPTRTSLIATLEGASDRPPLCLTGHIDTVPLGMASWCCDPFAGDIDQGRVYGRGATDMKGGVAAIVNAAVQIAAGPRPRAGLLLVITAGEEDGCEGAVHMAAQPGLLGCAGAILVGEPTGNYPLLGHKGAIALNAVTRGVTAHASMPEFGVNAIYAAARVLGQLEQFRFRDDPHPVMGVPTLNVGTIEGGMNLNSVPDRAVMGIDIRTIPDQSVQTVLDDLADALGEDVSLEDVVSIDGVYTEPTVEWVETVYDVMEPVLGERPQPRAASFFTDAAVLGPAFGAPPTVILGPGEPQVAHQTDEYCDIDKIDAATDAYLQIATRWCRA